MDSGPDWTLFYVERVWETRKIDTERVQPLSHTLGISEIAASLLLAKGMEDEGAARDFLHPADAGLHDPFMLDNMDRAVERVCRAVTSKERICIFGHEDVDGITATVTLLEALTDVGAEVHYYIPNRAQEGHSISASGVDVARERGTSLMITVDCEVGDRGVVKYAKKHGIDIIVTDHHEITKEIPSLINVNCKRGRYPNPFLSGVGVAYKLAQAVAGRLLELSPSQWQSAQRELLVLVLFGSTADRVPLLGENRTFAALGRTVLPRSRRVAVEVLKEKAVIREETASIGDVVPILSSARSSDGYNVGCEFLTTHDRGRAVEILADLRELSRQWYAESRRLYERIRRKADPTAKLIIVVDPTVSSYHLGYCANRLKEEYFKPAIVLSSKNGCYVGEGRSISAFNLVELLTHCKALLLDYGGHTQAAGFSISEKNVNAFVEKATDYANSSIDWSHLVRKIMIDGEISPEDLTEEVRKDLRLFRPFGEGNREPVFLIKGVTLKEIYADHIEVERGRVPLSVRTSFSKGKWVSLSGQPIKIDCVVSVGPERMPYLVDSRPSFTGTD